VLLEEPAKVPDVAQELRLVLENVPGVHEADGQIDLPLLKILTVHANFVSSVAV
jgi:hypothetical protein